MIKTFGRTEPQLKTADVVQPAVHCVDQLIIFIELYVIEVVCNPLANQCVNITVDKCPHFQGLPLAEPSTGGDSLEISVLTGSDYYWSIVGNEIIIWECGLIALSTELGFVLSGPVDTDNDFEISLNLNFTEHVMKTETFVIQEDVDLRNLLCLSQFQLGTSPPGNPREIFFERAKPSHPGKFFVQFPAPGAENDSRIPGGGAKFSQT